MSKYTYVYICILTYLFININMYVCTEDGEEAEFGAISCTVEDFFYIIQQKADGLCHHVCIFCWMQCTRCVVVRS